MTMDEKNETSNGALRLSDLAGYMERMLREFSSEIHRVMESTILLIQSQIASIREHIQVELKHVTENIRKTSREMERMVEASQRNVRRNELIMYGIPSSTAEDLDKYFAIVCSHLGYHKDHLPVVYLKRLGSATDKSTSIRPILIEFSMYNQRRDFFAKYLHTCTLSLDHLGFNSDRRIFVNENLTPMARRTLSAALRMKRDGALRNVSVRDGVIHVVCRNSSSLIVNNEEELLQLSINI